MPKTFVNKAIKSVTKQHVNHYIGINQFGEVIFNIFFGEDKLL